MVFALTSVSNDALKVQSALGTTIVQAQVDAFNAHDLDAFLATYSSDASVAGVAPETMVGVAQLREFYEPRFKDASLRCSIETMVTFGTRWVVAREIISSTSGTSETIATFEVLDGLITRASMLKA